MSTSETKEALRPSQTKGGRIGTMIIPIHRQNPSSPCKTKNNMQKTWCNITYLLMNLRSSRFKKSRKYMPEYHWQAWPGCVSSILTKSNGYAWKVYRKQRNCWDCLLRLIMNRLCWTSNRPVMIYLTLSVNMRQDWTN